MIYLVIYILSSILIGLVKALNYVTNIPVEQQVNIKTMFMLAFIVGTVLAPLVMVESIIGGIKNGIVHK